MFQSNVD